jgi:hypothetical protein
MNWPISSRPQKASREKQKMNIFIAEGYQPDCDGPVRWLESIHAPTIAAAREAVMPEFNASGDLCPDAVYTIAEARMRFGSERISKMFRRPLGYKTATGECVEVDDDGALPFYYSSFQYDRD